MRTLELGYGYGYEGSTSLKLCLSHPFTMQLSPREVQIVSLLKQGLTNKAIAQVLGISPHTVRDYISAMLQRDGAIGRAALVAIYGHRLHDPQAEQRQPDRREGSERRRGSRSTQADNPTDVAYICRVVGQVWRFNNGVMFYSPLTHCHPPRALRRVRSTKGRVGA